MNNAVWESGFNAGIWTGGVVMLLIMLLMEWQFLIFRTSEERKSAQIKAAQELIVELGGKK